MTSRDSEQLMQASERFTAWHDTWDVAGQGVPAFVKQAAAGDERTAWLVENQAAVAGRMNGVGAHARPSFRVPEVYHTEFGLIVMEQIDGGPLGEAVLTAEVAGTLAGVAAVFDDSEPSSEPPRFSFFQPYGEHMARVREELERVVQNGLADRRVVARSLEQADALYPRLHSRMQHADLTPGHVYPDPTGQREYVLVDAEYARPTWPQFFDLGNMIDRYMIVEPNPAFAGQLLTAYLQCSGRQPDDVLPALKATLLFRSLTHVKAPGLDLLAQPEQIRRERAETFLRGLLTIERTDDLLRVISAAMPPVLE